MKTNDGVEIKVGDKVWVVYSGLSEIVTVVRLIPCSQFEAVEVTGEFKIQASFLYANHPVSMIPATADEKIVAEVMKIDVIRQAQLRAVKDLEDKLTEAQDQLNLTQVHYNIALAKAHGSRQNVEVTA